MQYGIEKSQASEFEGSGKGWPAVVLWSVMVVVALTAGLGGASCFGLPPRESAEIVQDRPAPNIAIPFRLYNDNLVIIKGTVGAIKNLNLILDTGTSPSIVSKALAGRLGLKGQTEGSRTLSGAIETQSVILPHLQIGELRADSIRVVVQDLGFMERSLGISLAGIVGLDILKTSSFTIDYKTKEIVFGPIVSPDNTVPFEMRSPLLTVRALVDGQEVRLLVDSGTWGLLVYRNRIRTGDPLRTDSNVSVSSPSGFARISWLSRGVQLGRRNLGTRKIGVADVDADSLNGFDGLLGFAGLGFRKVCFDFEHGLLGWE